ncbi:MAG: hypothetical protein DDT24_00584 [Chloroflexi bacterium]|nr:hypothetical protein [Chloroflexota bacterium]
MIFDELCSRHEAIKEILEHTSVMTAWLRLREGLGLKASYSSFYRYVWKHLPDVLERTSITVRREDSPPGEEAQVDFGYPGLG